MKAAAVNASILSAEFVPCFTALLHSDQAIDAYHKFWIAPLSILPPRSPEGASGAGERRRNRAAAIALGRNGTSHGSFAVPRRPASRFA
jgi:hypothetical protein